MSKFRFELPIYTFQIDFAGHVSNIVYIQWMEMGRGKLLEAAGMSIKEFMEKGIVPVLASTEIAYRKPLTIEDTVTVEIWYSQLTRATARFQVRFYNARGELAASGSHRGVFTDRETGRPKRLSSRQRAAFEDFLIEEDDAGE